MGDLVYIHHIPTGRETRRYTQLEFRRLPHWALAREFRYLGGLMRRMYDNCLRSELDNEWHQKLMEEAQRMGFDRFSPPKSTEISYLVNYCYPEYRKYLTVSEKHDGDATCIIYRIS